MPDLKASKELVRELREIHSGIQTAMDALMKHFDPTEAGRILMLVDGRFTTLINRVAVDATEPPPAPPRSTGPVSPLSRTWTVEMLYSFYDRSSVPHLLPVVSRETGKRVMMRRVEGGLDLLVEGISDPLGMIRLGPPGGAKIVYSPRVGAKTFKLMPDPDELERWVLTILDVWKAALSNIGQRRQGANQAGANQTGADRRPSSTDDPSDG